MYLDRDAGGEYAAFRIGRRIRHFRRARGWSLKDLGSRLGLSPATLSNIERDRISLDVDRLFAIGSALEVGYAHLLPRVDDRHFQIVRRSEMRMPGRPLKAVNPDRGPVPYHNLVRPLAQSVAGRQIEPFHIRAVPVGDADLSFINHGHEEFFFVLSGKVECLLQTPDGLVRQILGEGDCMYFWSSLPHCIRSAGPDPADTIHVLCVEQSEGIAGQPGETSVFSRDWPLTLRGRVGGRVKSLRQGLRMAASQFASAAGVGARWLADVEQGRKPIPIDFLLTLSRRFQKPVDYFLAGAVAPAPQYFVQRAADMASVSPRTRRASPERSRSATDVFRPLASGFPNRSMHPYYVKLADRESDSAALHEHYGQEFIYVLNAEVKLVTTVEGVPFTEILSAGDACFLDSTVPHRFVGAHVNPFEPRNAEVIDVFWSPLGESYLFDEEEA